MMSSFYSANQARLSLKMQLSQHAWYAGSSVEADGAEYCVVVYVAALNDEMRKTIPSVHMGVSIKTDVSSKHKKQRQGE